MTHDAHQALAEHLAAAARAAGVEDLVRGLLERVTLSGADPRPSERRDEAWRGSEEDGVCSDPIETEEDGELSWCDQMADVALDALRTAPPQSESPPDGGRKPRES